MSEKSKAEREAELDQKLLDAIEKHGWFGMQVSPRADDPDPGPQWEYSIGFERTHGQPNVIVFGLKRPLLHYMLGQIHTGLLQGRTLVDGDEWTTPLDNYICVVKAVHESHLTKDWFGYGMWYRRTHAPEAGPYTAFQLFWPGVGHRLMPWDEGCDEAVIWSQPRLDLPKSVQ